MHAHSWTVSDAILLLAVLAFIVATVLVLSVVTKSDSGVECDRANTTRATLLMLTAFSIGILVLAFQRLDLSHAVKNLMA